MWNIVFYTDIVGSVRHWSLSNHLSVLEQVKVRNALRLLREFGINLDVPHAKHIHGKLWELRPGGVRLFYFAFIGQQFFILHGYRKQGMKAPAGEFSTAVRRMNELLDEG